MLVLILIVAVLCLAGFSGFFIINKIINGNQQVDQQQLKFSTLEKQLKSEQDKISELQANIASQQLVNNEQAAMNKKIMDSLSELKSASDVQDRVSSLQNALDLQQQQLLIVEQAVTDIKAAAKKVVVRKAPKRVHVNKPVNTKLPFLVSRVEWWNQKPVVIVNNSRVSVGENYSGYKLISVNQDKTAWQNLASGKTIISELQQ